MFQDTIETYYELVDKRVPGHGEDLARLKQNRILIDGAPSEEGMLLQIFTENLFGPIFFEIIQRKGNEGFGNGNFQALFESIELDQIRRGVIKVDVSLSRPTTVVQEPSIRRSRTSPPAIMPGFGNHSRPKPSPARCRSAATRRSARRSASTPSSCPAPPSPRRAHENRRTWLYRLRPSAGHAAPSRPTTARRCCAAGRSTEVAAVAQSAALGSRCPLPDEPTDFVDGLVTHGGNGDPAAQARASRVHLYARQPLDGRPRLLRRRRRAADRAAGRARCALATELGV